MNRSPDDEDEEREDAEAESVEPEEELEVNGYRLVSELTRGGQAAVFLAIQKSTGRKVALKLMFGGRLASELERQRMDQEVRILAALDHPNIVSVIDRGVTPDGSPYFVMNYVDGRSFNEFIDDYHRDHGGPTQMTEVGDLLKVFKRICEAVNAAHLRGIVHRDLKPANIVIDAYGEPHILDFGLAHAALALGGTPANAPTRTGEFVGSLEWASPEQASGDAAKIDTRTDVYALGVMLYEVLTGEFPYDVFSELREVLDHIVNSRPAPPSALILAARQKEKGPRAATAPAVDARLDAIVLKALSKNREERYQTAGEMARDLGQYLEGKRPEAPPPLRRVRTYLALGGLLALAAGGLAYRYLAKESPPPATVQIALADNLYGYAVQGNEVYFIFEPVHYELARHENGRLIRLAEVAALNRVSVVGSFNAWVHDEPDWRMREVTPGRFELRMPLSRFADRSEWPFKFLVNGELWVGAPANAANREVVVADNATFNIVFINPKVRVGADTAALRAHRDRINKSWPGQGANLAVDEKQRYHFTFSHLPPGVRVTDLEPLRGLPLASLELGEAKVTDLSPLDDMATLARLYISDGAFQTITTDLMAALRRFDFNASDQAAEALFRSATNVPALTAARQLILHSARNLRSAREQPGQRPPHTHAFGGHRYAFIVYPMSWTDARDFARGMGGYLASATSDEENAWLASTFGAASLGRMLWLGGTDDGTESFWRWTNGEGWRYEHWTSPEPNNNNGREHALALKPDGWWIDADGYALNLPFVVEWND